MPLWWLLLKRCWWCLLSTAVFFPTLLHASISWSSVISGISSTSHSFDKYGDLLCWGNSVVTTCSMSWRLVADRICWLFRWVVITLYGRLLYWTLVYLDCWAKRRLLWPWFPFGQKTVIAVLSISQGYVVRCLFGYDNSATSILSSAHVSQWLRLSCITFILVFILPLECLFEYWASANTCNVGKVFHVVLFKALGIFGFLIPVC